MQLTIFQRLTAGYLAIMFLVLSFGGYVAFQLNRLTRITHLAAGADSEVIQIAESLSTRIQILVSLEKKYWISEDSDFYRLFLKRQREFLGLLKILEPLLPRAQSIPGHDKTHIGTDPAGTDRVEDALDLSQSYFNTVNSLVAKTRIAPPAAYDGERDELIDKLSQSLNQIRLAANVARSEKIRRSELISARVLKVTIGFAAACIVLGFAVSWLTTKRIVRPILALQQKTRAIAVGHFVKMEEIRSPPEIRHLTEEFNAMSARLKELDRLKEDFVSHVSHALRTPLTAIREASEMLIKGTFDNDPSSRSQLLTIVRDECKRLIVSVNRILDLSRMEGGMMDYRFEKVDLNELIRSAVGNLNPIARAKQIDLRLGPLPDLPPVRADSDQLHQLLENLIGNALKFTDPMGSVTLKVLTPAAAEGTIQVCITDTGYGIEPEHLESIFNKFRSIEKGKNTTRGTGLGLAIAKHIVTAHGGSIWVESEKGRGSTFYFSLPPA